MIQQQNNFVSSYEQNMQAGTLAKTFMSRVFTWMFMALGITALVSYTFASSMSLMGLIYNFETGSMSLLGWVVMLAPLAFVLIIGFRFRSLSRNTLLFLFVTFAILMGMSLSSILLVYTGASIFTTFMVTAGTFGAMAILGYTTKTDLTKFGSILMMGLIGIILASVVNFFLNSATMDYVISILGVLIFTGLTAYDVQKLKNVGMAIGPYQGIEADKLAIVGALTLYLDFINLFLFLLRFLGNRR
jgi:FtsH-binding integral membrane protein